MFSIENILAKGNKKHSFKSSHKDDVNKKDEFKARWPTSIEPTFGPTFKKEKLSNINDETENTSSKLADINKFNESVSGNVNFLPLQFYKNFIELNRTCLNKQSAFRDISMDRLDTYRRDGIEPEPTTSFANIPMNCHPKSSMLDHASFSEQQTFNESVFNQWTPFPYPGAANHYDFVSRSLLENAFLDQRHLPWSHSLQRIEPFGRRRGGQVRFTLNQTKCLEEIFKDQKYISPTYRKHIAEKLNLQERQIKTWFQNRRAKWRKVNQPNNEDCLQTNGEPETHLRIEENEDECSEYELKNVDINI